MQSLPWQARLHVRGAELLAQLGQAASAKVLAAADKAAASRMLRTSLARIARAKPAVSDARCAPSCT